MRMLLRVLAIVLATMVHAAAADRPQTGAVPDWVVAVPELPAPPPTTPAPILLLLNDQQVRFSDAGVDYYVDSRARIQTPQGLAALGTISLAWRPDTDEMIVHRLVARRGADVRDLLAGDASFTVLRREDQLEQSVLTGTLTAILQPPDLQVGDIIELSYTLRRAERVLPEAPSRMLAWPNTPMHSVRFRATWPGTMAVQWKFRDFEPQVMQIEDGSMRGIAFVLDDPQALPQPDGAPAHFVALRRLELSTFQSWPQLAARLAPLYEKASTLSSDSPLRAEAARIRAASRDPAARAAAALRLVQEQIRYVLLAMNDGGMLPASAEETWQRRFGDCKAKTVLLLALLRELGVDAQPVLVNTALGRGIDRSLPGPELFDHVLVRASIDGRTYWLDGTRPADRQLDLIPVPTLGWGLPLVRSGGALVRIEPQPLTQPRFERELHIDASAGLDRPAQLKAATIFRGDAATGLRLALEAVPAGQKEQMLEGFWREQLDRVVMERVESHFDEAKGEITLSGEGTILLEWDDDWHEVDGMHLGYRADFTRPKGADAGAPYAVSYPEYTVNRNTIVLPRLQGAYELHGTDVDMKIAGMEFRRTARLENLVLKAESLFRTLAAEFPASEAPKAEAALRELSRNGLHIWRPKPPPSADELRSQADTELSSAAEYIDRADEMSRQRLYELALNDLGRALALDPQSSVAYSDRGNIYVTLGRRAEAVSDFEKSLALQPDDPIALRGLGALANQEGRHTEAIDLLTRALAAQEHAWTRRQRATAHIQMRNYQAALLDLTVLTRSNTAEPTDFRSHAMALSELNRMTEARALAEDVLERKIGMNDGVILAMQIYDISGAPDESRALLERSLERSPSVELYVMRAMSQSDLSLAQADLESALKLDPRSNAALTALVSLLRSRRDDQAALSLLERVEQASAPTTLTQRLRGELLAESQDHQAASLAFRRSRELASTYDEYNSLCWSQATANLDLDKALLDCEAALERSPRCAACLDSRAFVLLRQQRYAEAIADFDAALALQPRLPAALFGRGIARIRAGQETEGEADLEASRRLAPGIDRRYAQWGVEP